MRKYFVGLAIMTIAALTTNLVNADDQQIAEQVVEGLKDYQAEGELRGFAIDLEVEEGTVLLVGHVANKGQQLLVLNMARQVPGVTEVVNDLEIKPSATEDGFDDDTSSDEEVQDEMFEAAEVNEGCASEGETPAFEKGVGW